MDRDFHPYESGPPYETLRYHSTRRSLTPGSNVYAPFTSTSRPILLPLAPLAPPPPPPSPSINTPPRGILSSAYPPYLQQSPSRFAEDPTAFSSHHSSASEGPWSESITRGIPSQATTLPPTSSYPTVYDMRPHSVQHGSYYHFTTAFPDQRNRLPPLIVDTYFSGMDSNSFYNPSHAIPPPLISTQDRLSETSIATEPQPQSEVAIHESLVQQELKGYFSSSSCPPISPQQYPSLSYVHDTGSEQLSTPSCHTGDQVSYDTFEQSTLGWSSDIISLASAENISKATPRQPKRKRASKDQLQRLESTYGRIPCPSKQEREELGRQLGMTAKSVKIWFKNRRYSMRHRGRSADGGC